MGHTYIKLEQAQRETCTFFFFFPRAPLSGYCHILSVSLNKQCY